MTLLFQSPVVQWLRRRRFFFWIFLFVGFSSLLVLRLHLAYHDKFGASDIEALLKAFVAVVILFISSAGIYSLMDNASQWYRWDQRIIESQIVDDPVAPESQIVGHDDDQPLDRLVIYFDGIHQVDQTQPPRISEFLQILNDRLPSGTRLVKDLGTYAVGNTSVVKDPNIGRVIRPILKLRDRTNSDLIKIIAMIVVEVSNVIKVGILSDSRYGPIVKFQEALKVYALLENEVDLNSNAKIFLLGYSGGGQMALGSATYLAKLCKRDIVVITLCGVFSGNQELSQVSSVVSIIGSKDPVSYLCRYLFPRRFRLSFSQWAYALRKGKIKRIYVDGMMHNGADGPFDELYREKTIDKIIEAIKSYG